MDADALSTAVFVLGYEKGKALLGSFSDTGAVFVFNEKNIKITGDLDFILTNSDYRIIDG
jgi:thiamine biosynthesis lipoprotein